ncbi:MAG: hypothetical protein ACHP79_13790, partial [Terriglobales bacterium]
ELGPDAQVGSTLNSMTKGEVSQIIQSTNKLAMAVLTNINPPHQGEFSEVAAQARQNFILQKGSALAAAKNVGIELKTADFFSMSGAAEGIGPGRVLNEAFDKPDGTLIGPVSISGQTIYGKVVARQPADMAKLAEQRETIVTQIKAAKAQLRQSLLVDSVMTRLIQEGKVKKHQDVINRLLARYRS